MEAGILSLCLFLHITLIHGLYLGCPTDAVCDGGLCIEQAWRCDGILQCQDGADEDNCDSARTTPTTQSTKPTTQSTKPTTQSTKPTTQSTKPTTQSTKPTTQPSKSTTQPSTSTTRSTKSTETTTKTTPITTELSSHSTKTTWHTETSTKTTPHTPGSTKAPKKTVAGYWVAVGTILGVLFGVTSVIIVIVIYHRVKYGGYKQLKPYMNCCNNCCD